MDMISSRIASGCAVIMTSGITFGAMHGGKERAMAGILSLSPDAIIVKEGTLCPGSYFMSKGRMKYIPVEEEKFDEVMKNLPKITQKAVPELEPLMYQE